ncbi:MAG: helix-turn-helix transcriptional regulator [Planctomycetes bacterium]|nr:helix-turn-helix transcriptional regulator [Planctomycetota bacterium]
MRKHVTATPLSRERWHLLKLELYWVYRGAIDPRYIDCQTFTPASTAWLILRGWAGLRCKSGVVRAQENEWLVAPPGERTVVASRDCELLSIAFVARWAFGRELFPLPAALVLSGGPGPALRGLAVRLACEAERWFPRARYQLPASVGSMRGHLRLAAAFYPWFEAFADSLQSAGLFPDVLGLDSRIEQALRALDRDDRQIPTPGKLARLVALSPSQLNRLFRRELGKTVRNYCESRKLDAARSLLVASNVSIKETAHRLGFLSSQHFSRWFRRSAGTTPSHYRTHCRAVS